MTEYARIPDDLPVYECGEWTRQKLFFLCNYLAQFTQAMIGNPKWASMNYVDLFASSGICSTKNERGDSQRYPGSALLAAGCLKPFDTLFLVERESEKLNALKSRIDRLNPPCKRRYWTGDTNETIGEVAAALPDKSLTVAFVDPFSLDIHFQTIAALATARPIDLLILFADDMDLVRNVEEYYYPRLGGKLDLFLGPDSCWRDKWDHLQVRDAPHVRQLFSEIYLEQLKRLGYIHTETIQIPRTGRPLYRLIYASKHPLGLKFWQIAASEDFSRNKGLFSVD